jgi:transposase
LNTSKQYSAAETERMMKLHDVLLKAMAKKITWWEAAEIIGVTDRTMRRWRERLETHGYTGLVDRRKAKPSDKRVAVAQVEEVLRLYREEYFDLNMRHFHEKLKEKHQIQLSYTFVQKALQGAGLVARGRKRRKHRRRRERRPLPGMLLHIDGSKHQWFSDERVARPDCDFGRCHQRDLLCAASGRGIHAYGDGRTARGDRSQGLVLRAL